jgi:hypothetical protein
MVYPKKIVVLLITICTVWQTACNSQPVPTLTPSKFDPTPTVTVTFAAIREATPRPERVNPEPAPTLALPTIGYNEIKEGRLGGPAVAAEWAFQAQAGERINLVVNGQFDSYLELYGPEGGLIASNDDSGASLNAALFDIQIRQSGRHTILVRGYNTEPLPYALALTGGHPTLNQGVLNAGEPHPVILSEQGSKWSYQGQKNTYLTITATADQPIDTFLALYGPDSMLLASDDDSGPDLNAEIVEFQLPADGLYTVQARAVGQTGLATVTLQQSDKLAGGGELPFGLSQSGTIQPGRAHRWYFSGQAGQIINVTLTSADFDTFVELRNSQEVLLVENDDQAGTTDSAIQQFILPADDTYSLISRALSETAAGRYEISLKQVKVQTGGGPLRPDQPNEAVLLPGQADRWFFAGQAGTFVTVRSRSNQLDTYLTLADPAGTVLVEDDDSGGGLDAALLDFPLPVSGEYQVLVSSARADSDQAGVYEIDLTMGETLAVTGQLLPDQPQKRSLAQEEQHSWLFEATAGSYVTVQMQSDTLDTYLSLYNSEGTLLAVNDDFAGKQAALANFIVPSDGQYRLVARAYSGRETGDYTIFLQITEEPVALEATP